jgi:hypothetical protein
MICSQTRYVWLVSRLRNAKPVTIPSPLLYEAPDAIAKATIVKAPDIPMVNRRSKLLRRRFYLCLGDL